MQNIVPLDAAPHLLQNLAPGGVALATAAGGAAETGVGPAGRDAGRADGLAASRVSAPHFTQNIPLTGAPHLLQKLAMIEFSCHSVHVNAPLTIGGG
ncbi:MAG TPA: hypothetical protein VEU11_12645 [Terriglobales bacterium]|nr:hypothetical protein [Terriglobales bacterium]